METTKMFQKGYTVTMATSARKMTMKISRNQSPAVRFSLILLGTAFLAIAVMFFPLLSQNSALSFSLAVILLALITRMKETMDLNRPTAVP